MIEYLLLFVYASCFRRVQLELWDDIRSLDSEGKPWFLAGDFNIIRDDGEKVGVVH